MSSNIEIKRVCQHCGKEFTARTTKTQYCSHACNSKAYKAKLRATKIEKSISETKRTIIEPIENVKAKEFLSIKEVSSLVGISIRTVYRLIEQGDLKKVKIGTRTIIKRTELNNLLEQPTPKQPQQKEPNQYDISECYSIGEIQRKYRISEKGLYDIIKQHNVPKTRKGKFSFVPKTIIDSILS